MPILEIPDFDNSTMNGATCCVCGGLVMPEHKGAHRLAWIEHEGHFDVCNVCVLEAATQLGALSVPTARKLRDENRDLKRDKDRLVKRVRQLEQLTDTLSAELAERAAETGEAVA
jgi:hypothetical protein